MDNLSVLAEFHDRQRTLATLLDQIDNHTPGSAEFTTLYGPVVTAVRDVVEARNRIPRRRHVAARNRYHLPIRILGAVMIVGAVVAGGLSVATWHEQWLLVLTLPAAAVGVLFAHNGGGPTDLQQSLLPPGIRLGLAVLGMVAVAVIYLAGFINGRLAMIEIPAAAAAVVLTLAVMQALVRPSAKETP